MKQSESNFSTRRGRGLYEPSFEKDACGIGLIARISGEPGHDVVRDGLEMLLAMDHRGARGCETNTGDGAGLMCAIPDSFFRQVARNELGCDLPETGLYAVGSVFLPRVKAHRARCKRIFAAFVESQGQVLMGWRKVPTRAKQADIGHTARLKEPAIEQVFIRSGEGCTPDEFQRQLYLIRKQAYHALQDEAGEIAPGYYVASLSSATIVYKGQLTAGQLPVYFPDLQDERFASHLAIVHSRFSTNTFPSWERAQPMRLVSHNGEINTLKGNLNWARAREPLMACNLFGEQFRKLLPIIDPVTSDSGMFDNVLELLALSGRPLPEAVSLMIPEAWESNPDLCDRTRALFEFGSCLMEPWDGPAALTFADRRYAGAALDRNGLRPCRYCLTTDGRFIVSSEAGALKTRPDQILAKGRIGPGQIMAVDFNERRLLFDAEVKAGAAEKHPYRSWITENAIDLDELAKAPASYERSEGSIIARLTAFGYTKETLDFMLVPLVEEGRDPIGSMGTDTPLAALSEQPRLVFEYLKQLFAQVTNPPIDPIREENVMSLQCFVGPEGNLLAPGPESCRRLRVREPVLTREAMSAIKNLSDPGVDSRPESVRARACEGDALSSNQPPSIPCRGGAKRTKVLDATMSTEASLEQRLLQLAFDAKTAVEEGYSFIVLSDRNISQKRVHVPSLLSCGAVHHFLIKAGLRTRTALFVETGEAREVHHFCCLFGYGADGVCPYLAYECIADRVQEGKLPEPPHAATERYRKAVHKGILKVLAKLGVSTLQSYKGAQAFEALGLSEDVVNLCLSGTPARLGGHGFEELKNSLLRFHAKGIADPYSLASMGDYQWRGDGERHMWNPDTIAALQAASRAGDGKAFERFAELANRANGECTIRGMLGFKAASSPTPLPEVECAGSIVHRFCTGAMSFGSLSKETHETLAVAMNRVGGRSNTGEGGEHPERLLPNEAGDSRRSAIKQVASGRFGVSIDYLSNADEIQIKMAQGAKPGEGGELPGGKVGAEIARIRCSTPGVGLISPPPHHDIYSIEDLAQLIFDLKRANPDARISVKLVSEVGVGVVAAGVAKAHADHILISGHDGGTGASPLTSIKNAGLPWELGLSETHQTLVLNGLRQRVVLQTDGQMKTGRDVAIAALLGADEVGFSTAPLIALGCIMMRKCHLNTCPVGIATQDPVLRQKFRGEPEHVINYLFMVAEEVRQILSLLGLKRFEEMVGRSDLLVSDRSSSPARRSKLDLTRVIEVVKPMVASAESLEPGNEAKGWPEFEDGLCSIACEGTSETPSRCFASLINNTDRAVGTRLSREISKRFGNGLDDGSFQLRLVGSAGQSFGAWLAKGLTLELEGESNDYLGKGLSGGRIVLYPPKASLFKPDEAVIAGNAVLYGAICGEAYISGRACERFAVRNSGANAVVEGVGDHGCEYMTGGRVIVLGEIGRNFAAGMSGGVAYVLCQEFADVRNRINLGTVDIELLVDWSEAEDVRGMVSTHFALTGSAVAKSLLGNWPVGASRLLKVMPRDYKRALESMSPPGSNSVLVGARLT